MTIYSMSQMSGFQIWRGATWLPAAVLGLVDWLRLAAAPSYAFMAIFIAVFGESPKDMLCMGMHHASPLSGMAWMYVLMSAFHAAPWLKLIAAQQSAARIAYNERCGAA
jgi:hypothetical protein